MGKMKTLPSPLTKTCNFFKFKKLSVFRELKRFLYFLHIHTIFFQEGLVAIYRGNTYCPILHEGFNPTILSLCDICDVLIELEESLKCFIRSIKLIRK